MIQRLRWRRFYKLTRTCTACPAQWDAYDAEGTLAYYIRYRWGWLSLSLYREDGTIGEEVEAMNLGHGDFHGCIDEPEMLEALYAEKIS